MRGHLEDLAAIDRELRMRFLKKLPVVATSFVVLCAIYHLLKSLSPLLRSNLRARDLFNPKRKVTHTAERPCYVTTCTDINRDTSSVTWSHVPLSTPAGLYVLYFATYIDNKYIFVSGVRPCVHATRVCIHMYSPRSLFARSAVPSIREIAFWQLLRD